MHGWIDAHCHLFRLKDPDASAARSREAGVEGWVQGAVGPDDWALQLGLRRRLGRGVLPVFGLHPWWVVERSPAEIATGLSELERRLGEAAGLGELGLDYSSGRGEPEKQREAFRAQLSLARRAGKPVVLHLVRSDGEALEILREEGPLEAGGIVHSFAGSRDTARALLDLGLHLSIGPRIASRGFQKLKDALKYLPIDRIVLETDTPDGAPESGKLPDVASAVAALLPSPGIPEKLLDDSARALRGIFEWTDECNR